MVLQRIEYGVSEVALASKATMRLDVICRCQLSRMATMGKLSQSPTPQIILRKLKNHRKQAQQATIYRVHQVLMPFRTLQLTKGQDLTSQNAVISSINGKIHLGTRLWSVNSGE
jgi:hypothetical protein